MSYNVEDNIFDNEKNLCILNYYEQFVNALDSCVSIDNLRALVVKDIIIFIKNYNKENTEDYSSIKDLRDLEAATIAYNTLDKEYEKYESNGKRKRNFFDFCLKEKEVIENMLEDGISFENIQNMFEYDFEVYKNNHSNIDVEIKGAEDLVTNQDEVESFALDIFSKNYNNQSASTKKSYLNKKLALEYTKKQLTEI